MPVYEEKEKVDGKKRYYIRTYVFDEYGIKRQITKHNKNWIGKNGQYEAQQEENRLKNNCYVERHEKIKLYDLIDDYLKNLKNTTKLGTLKRHIGNIERYIKTNFKNCYAMEISNKRVLEWKSTLDNTNLALNSKKSAFITFSAIISHGCKFHNLQNNPFKVVGNFSAKKGHTKRDYTIMSEEQFKRFIEVENDEKYKAIYTILYYTGIRRGELLALTWADVNFDLGRIDINKTLNPKIKDENDVSPKTDKANRIILMTEKVKESFSFLKGLGLETPASFVTLTTLKRRCDNNCAKIGVRNFRIHDFRHSFASLCIEKNIAVSIISNYMGHENISTTLNTYGHLYPDSQEKLVNALNCFS